MQVSPAGRKELGFETAEEVCGCICLCASDSRHAVYVSGMDTFSQTLKRLTWHDENGPQEN